MAVALRGMSSYPTTSITYVDSARPLHEKEWFQRFWTTIAEAGPVDIELFNADMNSLKRALEGRGIRRTAPESLAETTEMARASLREGGRAV